VTDVIYIYAYVCVGNIRTVPRSCLFFICSFGFDLQGFVLKYLRFFFYPAGGRTTAAIYASEKQEAAAGYLHAIIYLCPICSVWCVSCVYIVIPPTDPINASHYIIIICIHDYKRTSRSSESLQAPETTTTTNGNTRRLRGRFINNRPIDKIAIANHTTL